MNHKGKNQYKSETRKTYDQFPELFEQKFLESFEQFGRHLADQFAEHLSGKKILDAGCGPGHHGKYLQDKGLDVVGIDISPEMVRLAQAKGVNAEVGDVESLRFRDSEFDGVWANAILLHVPKEKAAAAVKEWARVLKAGGITHISVKEGTEEGFEERKSMPGTRRWFTHFTEEEMRAFLELYFEVITVSRTPVEDLFVFLEFLLRKK